MANIRNSLHPIRHGKLNKKDDVIYREQYGKERMYSMRNPYNGPASEAQTQHRSHFGKVNSIVNVILADPKQHAEWTERKEQYNKSLNIFKPPYPKRFQTTRQYVYAVVSAQLKLETASKNKRKNATALLPKGVTLHISSFADLTASDIYEILKARYNVFTIEQGIVYPDADNIDYLATHLSLRRNGLVIAYARLFPSTEADTMLVGRMLTVERGKGLGRFLMQQIIEEAQRQGATRLRLHAQTQAADFYRLFHFKPVGDIFTEAGIPHILMERKL